MMQHELVTRLQKICSALVVELGMSLKHRSCDFVFIIVKVGQQKFGIQSIPFFIANFQH